MYISSHSQWTPTMTSTSECSRSFLYSEAKVVQMRSACQVGERPCFTCNSKKKKIPQSLKNNRTKCTKVARNRSWRSVCIVHLQISVLMGVVRAPPWLQTVQTCTETNGCRLWSDDTWSLSSGVKFMVGMGVVQDPAVLGDLGTVVSLQESTGSVP